MVKQQSLEARKCPKISKYLQNNYTKNTTTFVSTTLPYGHFFFVRNLDLYENQQERDQALLYTSQRIPVKNLCIFFSKETC